MESGPHPDSHRSGPPHVTVPPPPFDPKIAARQGHPDLAAGSAGARATYRGRRGRGTAGPGQAGATFPGAHENVLAGGDRGKRDVGPLGKHRVVLEQRPDPREIVSRNLPDPENP